MHDTSELNALIVRHIADLEAALTQAKSQIDGQLERAAAKIIEEKRREFGWAGDFNRTLEEEQWFAPEEWRTADKSDNSFDLFFILHTRNGLEDSASETWLSYFVGVNGCELAFLVESNALKTSRWKTFLREQENSIATLRDFGFACDLKRGHLALPIAFDQEAIAEAFENEDVKEALAPMGDALDRIAEAKPVFDEILGQLRTFAARQGP